MQLVIFIIGEGKKDIIVLNILERGHIQAR